MHVHVQSHQASLHEELLGHDHLLQMDLVCSPWSMSTTSTTSSLVPGKKSTSTSEPTIEKRSMSTPLEASIMNWVRSPLLPMNIGLSSVDTFLDVEEKAHQKSSLPLGKLPVRSFWGH